MAILPGDSASYLWYGLHAERPDPTNIAPGALARAYETDTKTWWTWVNGAWQQEDAVQPIPPPPPPGPAQDQWSCNVAGWLTYTVLRAAVKKAVDLIPSTWIGDVIGGVVSGLLAAILPASIIADGLIDTIVVTWVTNHVSMYLSSFTASVIDDTLWGKIHCRIYTAIHDSPGSVQVALAAAGTAIAAIGGYPTGFFTGLLYLLDRLGLTDYTKIPLIAQATSYDCSTCATTGIGPTGALLQPQFDLTVSDGITTLPFVDKLEVVGGTVTGTSPLAILTIPAPGLIDSVTAAAPLHATTGPDPVVSIDDPLGAAHGGTGLDASGATVGQFVGGSGSGLELITLEAGANVSIGVALPNLSISAADAVTEVSDSHGHDLTAVKHIHFATGVVSGSAPEAIYTPDVPDIPTPAYVLVGESVITDHLGGFSVSVTLPAGYRMFEIFAAIWLQDGYGGTETAAMSFVGAPTSSSNPHCQWMRSDTTPSADIQEGTGGGIIDGSTPYVDAGELIGGALITAPAAWTFHGHLGPIMPAIGSMVDAQPGVVLTGKALAWSESDHLTVRGVDVYAVWPTVVLPELFLISQLGGEVAEYRQGSRLIVYGIL